MIVVALVIMIVIAVRAVFVGRLVGPGNLCLHHANLSGARREN